MLLAQYGIICPRMLLLSATKKPTQVNSTNCLGKIFVSLVAESHSTMRNSVLRYLFCLTAAWMFVSIAAVFSCCQAQAQCYVFDKDGRFVGKQPGNQTKPCLIILQGQDKPAVVARFADPVSDPSMIEQALKSDTDIQQRLNPNEDTEQPSKPKSDIQQLPKPNADISEIIAGYGVTLSANKEANDTTFLHSTKSTINTEAAEDETLVNSRTAKRQVKDIKVVLVDDDFIKTALRKAGACGHILQGLVFGSLFLKKTSGYGGKLDFAANGQHGIEPNTLYVTYTRREGYVVHNNYNFGNFLWGAAAKAVGVKRLIAQMGSHFNNFFLSPDSHGTFDSKDDQFSIRTGFHWKPERIRR